VKSFGCENSTTQLLPIQSWKRILPSVVSASKSGAVSPIARAIGKPPFGLIGIVGADQIFGNVIRHRHVRFMGRQY
jgi:hypothetical protein